MTNKIEETPESLKYKKILFWILGAFFGIIFIANGILVYLADSSWSGLTTKDAYQKGLEYNDTIEAHKKAKDLGWTGNVGIGIVSPTQVIISLTLLDKEYKLIKNAEVTAKLVRPTKEGFDGTLSLKEKTPGFYTINTPVPLVGNWDVAITAKSGEDISFFKKRFNTAE